MNSTSVYLVCANLVSWDVLMGVDTPPLSHYTSLSSLIPPLQGRFSLAARYHSSVAEIYEGELQEFDNAISNYEQAADFHRGEDSVR